MARGSMLLSSSTPCTAVPARVTIGHVQLRDVIICPHARGVVSYAQNTSIVEHDLIASNATPRKLVDLSFTPNSLSALVLPDSGDTVLAVGGQDADLHLSFHRSTASDPCPEMRTEEYFGQKEWESKDIVDQGSINNSVLLTSLSLTRSNECSIEPRLIVSNNDRSIKFYDVSLREESMVGGSDPRLVEAGQLRLHVPVNHSSISPDGRTLLSVGDSPDVYLHRIAGGSKLTFTPTATLSLSSHIGNAFMPAQSSAVPASFSTAFSGDGSKFAVASQEGVVVVWDVRSTKPLKVFHTDKSRVTTGTTSSTLNYETPWDWTRGSERAPGWGVRNVKFSPRGVGKEIMTFTEHTSLLHVIDARTFETEEIVRMPSCDPPLDLTRAMRPRSTSPTRIISSSPPPPPPRIFLFSGALEDTFRIPSVDPLSGTRPLRRSAYAQDDDPESIVVIPPLGDREVEADVRRLLGHHGLRTHSAILGANADYEREPAGSSQPPRDELMRDTEADAYDYEREQLEMDVDELEWECVSYSPSRAPSPGASAVRTQRPGLLARRESSGPYGMRRTPLHHRLRRSAREMPDVDQDLAGTCFDPTGTFVYVASTKGVAEWRVRGVERRWWADCAWK